MRIPSRILRYLAVANAVALAGGVVAWRAGMLPTPPGMMTPEERQLLSGSKSYSFAGLTVVPSEDVKAAEQPAAPAMTGPEISIATPPEYPHLVHSFAGSGTNSAMSLVGADRSAPQVEFRNPYAIYQSGRSVSMFPSGKSIVLPPELVWPMFQRLFPDASPFSLPEFSTSTPPGHYLHGRTP